MRGGAISIQPRFCRHVRWPMGLLPIVGTQQYNKALGCYRLAIHPGLYKWNRPGCLPNCRQWSDHFDQNRGLLLQQYFQKLGLCRDQICKSLATTGLWLAPDLLQDPLTKKEFIGGTRQKDTKRYDSDDLFLCHKHKAG